MCHRIALLAIVIVCQVRAATLVADHRAVVAADSLSAEQLAAVKRMWVSIPGESHSSGYRKGALLLQTQDPRFVVSVQERGDPEAPTDSHLRLSRASWGDVDHDSRWRYGYGEEDWYTSPQAVNQTLAFLSHAHEQGLGLSGLGFGWCWDMTWRNRPDGPIDPEHQVRWAGSSAGAPAGDKAWGLDADDSTITGNPVCLDTYLEATEAMIAHCASNKIPTLVFFTTAPVDKYTGEHGLQRYLKNQRIRDHVAKTPDRALLDYADILCWNDAGEQHLVTWTDHAGQERTYPAIHPDNMKNLDGQVKEDGDHIGEVGAIRLAKALWWMMAQQAGR